MSLSAPAGIKAAVNFLRVWPVDNDISNNSLFYNYRADVTVEVCGYIIICTVYTADIRLCFFFSRGGLGGIY